MSTWPVCTQCWERPEFVNKTALKQHSEAKHSKPREIVPSLFYCVAPGCSRSFKTEAGRITHCKVLHKIVSQPGTPRSTTPIPSAAASNVRALPQASTSSSAIHRVTPVAAKQVSQPITPRSTTPSPTAAPTPKVHSGLHNSIFPLTETGARATVPPAATEMLLEKAIIQTPKLPIPRLPDLPPAVPEQNKAFPAYSPIQHTPKSEASDNSTDVASNASIPIVTEQISADDMLKPRALSKNVLVSEDLVPCALLDFSLPSPGLSNTIDFTESSGSDDVLKPIDEELVLGEEKQQARSSQCSSDCCSSTHEEVVLPETASLSPWESVPSNSLGEIPSVPFEESDSESDGELESPIISSKSLPGTPFFEARASLSPYLNGDQVLVLEPATYYKSSKADGYTDYEDSASDTSSEVEDLNPAVSVHSKLFCRICRADTCTSLTATTCGHLFCYECIAQRVVETSRCPVCNNMILLYCLFKLDLES